MLILGWPLFGAALVPITVIETTAFRRITDASWSVSLFPITKANTVSTLVGIPLTWIALVLIEMAFALGSMALGASGYPPISVGKIGSVILSAPWLGPWGCDDGYWVVPVAASTLPIPSFLASAWLEVLVLRFSPSLSAFSNVRAATWRANLMNYIFLFVTRMGRLAFKILSHAAVASSR